MHPLRLTTTTSSLSRPFHLYHSHRSHSNRGLRSGTLAPALCVGMGAAAKLCKDDMKFDTAWITHLSDRLRK